MTHIVIHDDSSNVTQYAQFDGVQAAASYLEDLVNSGDGSNAQLFALEPIEFAVKSYVRIEVVGAVPTPDTEPDTDAHEHFQEATDASPAPEAPVDDMVEYVDAASVDSYVSVGELGDGATSGEPRRGLFGR